MSAGSPFHRAVFASQKDTAQGGWSDGNEIGCQARDVPKLASESVCDVVTASGWRSLCTADKQNQCLSEVRPHSVRRHV